jgi:molybdate transport system substrate-binding protein
MPDIKILSTHAVQEVLRELAPMFERVSGFSLKIDYDPANTLRRTIEGGASFDVVIVTRPVIDELALQGRVRRETCTDIGRSGLGVACARAQPNRTSRPLMRSGVRFWPFVR